MHTQWTHLEAGARGYGWAEVCPNLGRAVARPTCEGCLRCGASARPCSCAWPQRHFQILLLRLLTQVDEAPSLKSVARVIESLCDTWAGRLAAPPTSPLSARGLHGPKRPLWNMGCAPSCIPTAAWSVRWAINHIQKPLASRQGRLWGCFVRERGDPTPVKDQGRGIIALRLLVRPHMGLLHFESGLGIFPMLVWGGCRSQGVISGFGDSRDTALLVFSSWDRVRGHHVVI